MSNRIVLSGGTKCQLEMKGGKRKKYHKTQKKGGMRKSKAMKKSRRHHSRKGGMRRSKGAGMIHRAALPFGLLALQKMMHNRKTRKSLKKMGKRALKAPYRTAKFLL